MICHLSPIWEVSHGSEEGVLGVEDASLAHVPDLEASDQARYKHPSLTPQMHHIPSTCTDTTMHLVCPAMLIYNDVKSSRSDSLSPNSSAVEHIADHSGTKDCCHVWLLFDAFATSTCCTIAALLCSALAGKSSTQVGRAHAEDV